MGICFNVVLSGGREDKWREGGRCGGKREEGTEGMWGRRGEGERREVGL